MSEIKAQPTIKSPVARENREAEVMRLATALVRERKNINRDAEAIPAQEDISKAQTIIEDAEADFQILNVPIDGEGALVKRDIEKTPLEFPLDTITDKTLRRLMVSQFNITGSSILDHFIHEFHIAYDTASTVKIEPGVCVDEDNTLFFRSNNDITVDITVSGANGLDTGSETSDTWYAVYVIADSTGQSAIAGLFSLSATAPTLPTGYNKFRRIGWIRNDAASNILKFSVRGDSNDRMVSYDVERSTVNILTGGNATTYADVNASAFIPPTSRVGVLHMHFDPQSASNTLQIREDGSTITNSLYHFAAGGAQVFRIHVEIPVSSSQIFEYKVTNTNDTFDVHILGYRETL